MIRLATLLLIASVAVAEPPKIATHQIKLDGQTFTLPVGFTIERVAGPPLVDRPISASFDDRGRLYVTDSSGSNEKLTSGICWAKTRRNRSRRALIRTPAVRLS